MRATFSHVSRSTTASPRMFVLYLLAAPIALALAGCLSRPALVHQTFALHLPPMVSTNHNNPQGVLAMRTVQVSPLFERRSFVYRLGADLYEADPYAEFMVPPSRALAIPMRACLRGSGFFKDVLEPGSQLEADTFLEVHAQELYGDFRKPGPPAAVLGIRLLLFDSSAPPSADPGIRPPLLLQKDYARRVQLNAPTAVALTAGWNEALGDIMREASLDIANARDKQLANNRGR